MDTMKISLRNNNTSHISLGENSLTLSLTLCILGNFALSFLSADFFFIKINVFPKKYFGILLACQSTWIQTRSDILSALIWVQTLCKDYQPMTLLEQTKS